MLTYSIRMQHVFLEVSNAQTKLRTCLSAPYKIMGCSGRFLNSASFSDTKAAEPKRTKACTPAVATCGRSAGHSNFPRCFIFPRSVLASEASQPNRNSARCLSEILMKTTQIAAAAAIWERTFKLSPGENLYVPLPLLFNSYFSLVGASLLACTHTGSGKDSQKASASHLHRFCCVLVKCYKKQRTL